MAECVIYVPAPAKLLTVNAERRMNHYARATIIKQWRWAAKVECLKEHAPTFKSAEVEVHIFQKKGVLADVGGHYPVVKAIVDGMVDAAVLIGDSPEYLPSLVQHAPVKDKFGEDAVLVKIRGEILRKVE